MTRARSKRLRLEELEEIARKLTREALEKHESVSQEMLTRLTLGTSFDGDDRVFELYVAGERPEDAIVLTRARVNSLTGEGTVEVFLPHKKNAD